MEDMAYLGWHKAPGRRWEGPGRTRLGPRAPPSRLNTTSQRGTNREPTGLGAPPRRGCRRSTASTRPRDRRRPCDPDRDARPTRGPPPGRGVPRRRPLGLRVGLPVRRPGQTPTPPPVRRHIVDRGFRSDVNGIGPDLHHLPRGEGVREQLPAHHGGPHLWRTEVPPLRGTPRRVSTRQVASSGEPRRRTWSSAGACCFAAARRRKVAFDLWQRQTRHVPMASKASCTVQWTHSDLRSCPAKSRALRTELSM